MDHYASQVTERVTSDAVARLGREMGGEEEEEEAIVPFDFSEPSPDDIVLAEQKKAFVKGGEVFESRASESRCAERGRKGPIVAGGSRYRGPIVAGGRACGTREKEKGERKRGEGSGEEVKGAADEVKGRSELRECGAEGHRGANVLGGSEGRRESTVGAGREESRLNGEVKAMESDLKGLQMRHQSFNLGHSTAVERGQLKSLGKQMSEAKRERALSELMGEQEGRGRKERLGMVIIGHVDSGKSTTMGHVLYLRGKVDKRTIEKYEQESREIGKSSFHYAWVMDEDEEERLHGVTVNVAIHLLETEKYVVTILDAPGHRDFTPNLISGIIRADVALLVVDASSEFEQRNVLEAGQTREHILLARSLGIVQLIVAVNKMDSVGWEESKFESAKSTLLSFFKKIGFKSSNVLFVPISGLEGVNLVGPNSGSPSWYQGPTLLEAIDSYKPIKRDYTKPFRFSIADVFKDTRGFGVAVSGKIPTGFVNTGDKLLLMPSKRLCVVKAIRCHGELKPRAVAGENVEIGLQDVDIQHLNIGDVLCDPSNPIKVVSLFQAQLTTFNLEVPLFQGQDVAILIHNSNQVATLSEIIGICNPNGEITKKSPKVLEDRTNAIVNIRVQPPVCAYLFQDCRAYGRFTLRDKGKILAAGIITKILEQSPYMPRSSSSIR
ncbi:HBS1-like protein [Schistocerca gregaria]|uniref:HBS1-like protein n=1 Tax=Schistocerca gregaria TaxID=7010 RepID=UPI00211DD0AC|nr:HBS1-like protein [Schistocerca gregaria]